LDGLGQSIGRDTSTENGNVGFVECLLGERLDIGSGNGRVGGSVERVSESTSESKRVRDIDSDRLGMSEGRERFSLDDGQDELGVFVLVELCRGENGSEEG